MTRNSLKRIIIQTKSVIININNISDDFNRVVLEPEADIADSDYINASYVDVSRYWQICQTPEMTLLLQSLVQPKAYIVTQGPTESTMPDFWRMTWQERASCIVMVSKDP